MRHNVLTSCCDQATICEPNSMARILIIDDDKSFREALAESVRDFGHEVVEASGAQEALKLINEVDAAFLDLYHQHLWTKFARNYRRSIRRSHANGDRHLRQTTWRSRETSTSTTASGIAREAGSRYEETH
jgi:response regulator RpfG family c-di-GMP phosphodiesterase